MTTGAVLALARLIDANANRAREGLRVMEDVARFILDDADASRELKEIRHGLRGVLDTLAAAGVDRAVLLSERDTPGDVGTTISTPAEARRANVAEMVAAAAGRTSEALRVIEESAKVLGVRVAAESLRYRLYHVEKRLGLAVGAVGSGRCPQWRLCVLVTEALCRQHSWECVAELAVEGGADCLQLREKMLEGAELVRRARRLRVIAAGRAAVIVNDRADVALAAGVEGVHVGQGDLALADARRLALGRLWIGVSTSRIDEARAAAGGGADVCGVGPMFATTTKDKPVLAGPAYLRAYLADEACARVPHLAIGGVTPQNISELRATGCRGVAVSSVVCGADDPRGVCEALIRGLA